MSLEQLERQIQLASFALEKANKSGDKLNKAKVREELAKFTQVLERSKARLLELETLKRQCDELSEIRVIKETKSTLPKEEIAAKKEPVKHKRIESLVRIFSSGKETIRTLPNKKSLSFADEEPVEVTAEQMKRELLQVPTKQSLSFADEEPVEVTAEQLKKVTSREAPEEKHEEQPEERQEEPKEQPQEMKRDVAQAEERDDVQVQELEAAETSSVLDFAMSFGNQIVTSASGFASDVSSLGSQIFGTSEITKAINKEIQVQAMHRSRSADYFNPTSMLEPLKRFSTFGSAKSKGSAASKPQEQTPHKQTSLQQKFSEQEIEDHMQILRSFTSFTTNRDDETLSPEFIAEQELKAREKYIRLSKEHQQLRRTGLREDSPPMKLSEKVLRDCYAEIEYWESLGEEASRDGSRQKIKNFLGRSPTKSALDVDEETAKARDAYADAMMRHQSLVAKRVCTSSKEWADSQTRVNETLKNLQYWEGRAAFAVPPSL